MLPFTRARLQFYPNIFYYDRGFQIPFVKTFSDEVFSDLKNYLGIEREIQQHEMMSTYLYQQTGEEDTGQKVYDASKIERIEQLYDFYIDTLLRTVMQIYYTQLDEEGVYNSCLEYQEQLNKLMSEEILVLDEIEEGENFTETRKNAIAARTKKLEDFPKKKQEIDAQKFKESFDLLIKKSGLQLSKCFETAQKKCEPFYNMVKQMIEEEYPTKTFADKNTKSAKSFAVKKQK